jgi:hypothetical protein
MCGSTELDAVTDRLGGFIASLVSTEYPGTLALYRRLTQAFMAVSGSIELNRHCLRISGGSGAGADFWAQILLAPKWDKCATECFGQADPLGYSTRRAAGKK